MEYKIHQIEWTDEKTARFWNFYSQHVPAEGCYYTAQVGEALIRFSRKHARLRGPILDYGTGRGCLIEYLLQSRLGDVTGCDFSRDSVATVNARFQDRSGFRGCSLIETLPTAFPDGHFNTVFCIEAMEHLTDRYLDGTIREMKRLLAPGGILVITVPNNENLDEHKIACPDCGAVFHRVQHVRSFTKASITSLLAGHGFCTRACRTINLLDYRPRTQFRRWAKKVLGAFRTLAQPHLLYLGAKSK